MTPQVERERQTAETLMDSLLSTIRQLTELGEIKWTKRHAEIQATLSLCAWETDDDNDQEVGVISLGMGVNGEIEGTDAAMISTEPAHQLHEYLRSKFGW